MKLEDYIVTVKDFPKKGIMFRDVTPLLENKESLKFAIDSLALLLNDLEFDVIVGPESRGFLFGMPLAYNFNKSFVPVRKKGKLPGEVISEEYELEYGNAILEMHNGSIKSGDKVVIIDDLIATGGTIEAIINMVSRLGGEVVRVCCLIELVDFNARKRLSPVDIKTCLSYGGK